MDWIKQIIECKKENWVSPGSLGQKIKKIRMLRKYTQKELGVMCGFSFSSADVRIAQYEKNKKIPREKILKDMCNALGVGEGALIHADMLSYQEMFYALFDMEDFHGLRPVKKEDGYYLKFDSDSIINDFLEEWYKMYRKYPSPRGDDEEEKYRKLKEGASETVRSIVIMVNAQLRLFEIPEIKRIFEGTDDIDIPSLGLGVEGNPEKKTALFLVMPSGDSSYNLFINMFYTQLFTVLKRIADNRRDGQLPIHVRLWADEYYAGPKPLNCETLLGEIRSRNMSIVPILQDIAQIKTLYPNDKWEIFTGNCATTVFLGSGATAHTTHQWISDMLEDMTIDSRSENLGHSQGGNLQMSKGGMKLMTPGQVSRMPKNDCILFLKGERPIYDKKNWSFDTEVFKEAQEIAGKNGYKNPVYVSYDEKNRQYTTTRFESRLNYISQEDYEFYEEKAKTDDSIQTFQIDEDAFLYLNFNETPQPSLRELEKMVKKIQVSENSEDDENEGDEKKEDTVQDREKWDLSGDIMDCFQRYSSELSQEEQEEIIKGIEDGLTDQEIKRYFALYGADKMQQYRRVLTARKNRG